MFRPTAGGVGLLLGFCFALSRIPTSRISLGAALAIFAVMVVDAELSRRSVTDVLVVLTPTVSRSSTLDGLRLRAEIQGTASFDGRVLVDSGTGRIEPIDEDGLRYDVSLAWRASSNHRGLTSEVCHSEFGLVSCTRRFVQIFPTRIAAISQPLDDDTDVLRRDRLVDLERIREYVPGDRPSLVNWMVSAKTGNLHVRDDHWERDEMVVIVDLDADEDDEPRLRTLADIHFVVGAARHLISAGWDAGLAVRLVTMHDTDRMLVATAMTQASHLDPAFRSEESTPIAAARVADDLVHDERTMIERLAGIGQGSPPRPQPPYFLVTRRRAFRCD